MNHSPSKLWPSREELVSCFWMSGFLGNNLFENCEVLRDRNQVPSFQYCSSGHIMEGQWVSIEWTYRMWESNKLTAFGRIIFLVCFIVCSILKVTCGTRLGCLWGSITLQLSLDLNFEPSKPLGKLPNFSVSLLRVWSTEDMVYFDFLNEYMIFKLIT